jgi:hypothetical protein
MAESKSDESTNKNKGLSEFSSFIHPLTALRNFTRSERRPLLARPYKLSDDAFIEALNGRFSAPLVAYDLGQRHLLG